jgi:hypothetical protein
MQLHTNAAPAKAHVGRLLTKLGARDRAQLVRIAYESGLVKPGDSRVDWVYPEAAITRVLG